MPAFRLTLGKELYEKCSTVNKRKEKIALTHWTGFYIHVILGQKSKSWEVLNWEGNFKNECKGEDTREIIPIAVSQREATDNAWLTESYFSLSEDINYYD